jgi:lia operon protein LiaF
MTKRMFWGSALLLIGIVLLASNLGYLAPFSFWGLWPLLIIWPVLRIVFGRVFLVVGDRRPRDRIWIGGSLGLRLIALWILAGAAAELLHNLTRLPYDWGFVAYWTLPALLVGVGIILLLRPRSRIWTFARRRHDCGEGCDNVSSLIGEIDIGRRPWDFQSPMRLDLWIGDINVDLTTARLKPGLNYLYVTAWAGDVDIQAPDGIEVTAEAEVGAGQVDVFRQQRHGMGVGTKAARSADGMVSRGAPAPTPKTAPEITPEATPETETETTKLYIKVDLTFGDVRIK